MMSENFITVENHSRKKSDDTTAICDNARPLTRELQWKAPIADQSHVTSLHSFFQQSTLGNRVPLMPTNHVTGWKPAGQTGSESL